MQRIKGNNLSPQYSLPFFFPEKNHKNSGGEKKKN
jgi:hypothetical protein